MSKILRVALQLTDLEKAAVQAAAERHGMSVQRWIRSTLVLAANESEVRQARRAKRVKRAVPKRAMPKRAT